jgi:hypothetical protein
MMSHECYRKDNVNFDVRTFGKTGEQMSYSRAKFRSEMSFVTRVNAPRNMFRGNMSYIRFAQMKQPAELSASPHSSQSPYRVKLAGKSSDIYQLKKH